jgi:hypothetical protein
VPGHTPTRRLRCDTPDSEFGLCLVKDRLPPGAKRIARVQLVAAMSQVLGALQLVLLFATVGAGRSTDAYIVLFSASQLPASIISVGTLQPLIFSRPGYRNWAPWITSTVLACVACTSGTSILLVAIGYGSRDVVLPGLLVAVSGAVAAAVSVPAVERAMHGYPALLSGATILPNLFACVALALPSSDRVVAMCWGLLVGSVVTGVLVERARAAIRVEGVSVSVSGRDAAGLLASSTVGGLGPFALQAATATFPAGQASILGFASRLGAGLIGVGVTTFINSVTDWQRRSSEPLAALVGSALRLQILFLAVSVGGSFAFPDSPAMPVVLALAWVLNAAAQAATGRALQMAGSLGAFRVMAVTSLILYPAAATYLVLGSQTASGYFAILGVIGGTATLVFSSAIKWKVARRLAATSIGMEVVVLIVSVVRG